MPQPARQRVTRVPFPLVPALLLATLGVAAAGGVSQAAERAPQTAEGAPQAAEAASQAAEAAPRAAEGLVYPVDLVVDGEELVVADFKAHGLFRVGLDGRVSVIVQGEGLPRTPLYGTRAVLAAPDGDGWLVADPGTFGLYRVSDDGELSTLTTELDIPQGLGRFDDGSVLVSDLRSGIGAVMRVTLDGVVTVLAEIPSPKGIAADGDEGFVVVSHGERALYRLSRDGSFAKLASGEPFDFPHDVARLDDGRFVVTDGYASALFLVDPDGGVSTLARGEPLVNPQGVVLHPDGNLYVTDPQAGAIFRVGLDGTVSRLLELESGQGS